MIVTHTIGETREALSQAHRTAKTIGLVPTMGALHSGHMSLVDAARSGCDFVAVSIFVNPTQFAPSEDLDTYPRAPEADLNACESHGVDLVFMPSVEDVYGQGALTQVWVEELSETLCGRSRPTHFRGVCTIVAKLLNIFQPHRAYFGAKDYQQVSIIRRMVSDLSFPVEIIACPTVREADGLAMSSRNAYLSPEERRQAPALSVALQRAKESIRRSHPPAPHAIREIRDYLAHEAPAGTIEYVQAVDPDTLRDVETTEGPLVLALAVRFGHTRLIDNVLVDAPQRAP
jgi:pantoate--beta-alanine ligase